MECLNSIVYGRSRNSKRKAGEPINRVALDAAAEFLSVLAVIVDPFSSNGDPAELVRFPGFSFGNPVPRFLETGHPLSPQMFHVGNETERDASHSSRGFLHGGK